MRPVPAFLPGVALGLQLLVLPLAADAEQWSAIVRTAEMSLELDRASVTAAAPGSRLAWSRIVLGNGAARTAGYASVRILARYDCRKPGLKVLRRSFRDDAEGLLREETPANSHRITPKPGAPDDRLNRAVCQSASFAELRGLAEAAGASADRATEAAGPGANGTERIFPPPPRPRNPSTDSAG